MKCYVGLNNLLQHGLSEPEFDGELVYKLKKNVGGAVFFSDQLHGPSMLLGQKFTECSIISPALSLLMKHLVIGQRIKATKAKIYGVLYNQSSSIAFDEASSYWSAPKSY